MVQSFSAHKDYITQTVPNPAVDVVVTFPKTKWNVGGYFDPATSRFHPPAGIYHTDLSINVANPTDGGKYYAVIRRNGVPDDYDLLRPSRMSGGADTVGTSVSGEFETDGNDYFEAIFQHSNGSGSRTLGATPFETYWSAFLVADYVVPQEVGSRGHISGPIHANTFTYLDRSWSLAPGRTVDKLSLFTMTAGTYPLKIVRRNSAGNYQVILSQNIVHTGAGWEGISITPFLVPAGDYYVAVFTTGADHMMFDWKPRAFAPVNIIGSDITMTEQPGGKSVWVLGTRAAYAP